MSKVVQLRPAKSALLAGRQPNEAYRPREYLTLDEIRLLKVAGRKAEGRARWLSVRDQAIVWTTFRHALRSGEVRELRWAQVDFDNAQMQVRRLKNGKPGVHPIDAEEIRLLRRLKRVQKPSPWVFISTHGGPLTKSGFKKLIRGLGALAGLDFPIHPHMLRHACGYALTERDVHIRVVQDFMGHRDIASTAIYTALSPGRFKGLFGD